MTRLRLAQLLLAIALPIAVSVVLPSAVMADPTVAAKQTRYRQVRQAIARLDRRSEVLTERYDRARWRLGVLHRQIAATTERLRQAEAELVRRQDLLANVLVEAYQTGDPGHLAIVLGARSLADVTAAMESHDRLDSGFAAAVQAVRAAREAISRERGRLMMQRRDVRHELRVVDHARRAIRAKLERRRVLVRRLGSQVAAGVAAERIGEGALALQAAGWIERTQRGVDHGSGAWLRDQVALEGLAQIGVPYKWGGASPADGFDCSGLLVWLWGRHHIRLPHFAAAQYAMGPAVAKNDLEIGDLVFFHNLGHMGMYIGHGYVLHAPHTGSTVRIDPLAMGWFERTYVGATRPGPP